MNPMPEPLQANDLFYQQMGSIRSIHLIGIGGVGMCGIAEVLFNLGYIVSGSDIQENQITEHLKSLGIKISYEHKAENIVNSDVIVISSAISNNNPELIAALNCQIPVISRAQMLGEIMRFRYGIAVSGTHGKTTTTSLVSCILSEAHLDPTYVIGGRINGGTNARLGQGKYMVVEADESDVSFLQLKPMIAVVTNIDKEHMENYSDDFDNLQNSFLQFLKLLPFYGLAVVCIEDETVKKIHSKIPCRTLTYGFDREADFCAINCEFTGTESHFTLLRKGQPALDVQLNFPGKHNILNAIAAIGAVSQCGVSDEAIVTALKNFKGVKRRFDVKGNITIENGEVVLLDDYGHHPSEIAATIDAVRSVWPDKRLVMLFQPHRFSRLKALFNDFVDALSRIEVLLLLEVYSAGEESIENINSKSLHESISKTGKVESHLLSQDDVNKSKILPFLKPGDILVTQGAGSIGGISARLTEECVIPNNTK